MIATLGFCLAVKHSAGAESRFQRSTAGNSRWRGILCGHTIQRGNRGTDGTISDVPVISIVWFVMIGDFQSRGDFPSVPRFEVLRNDIMWNHRSRGRHIEFKARHFERCSFAEAREPAVPLHDTDWASGNHQGSSNLGNPHAIPK